MHHIYHTEGIILGSKNFGEDSKYFYLFTRELGMVVASAMGIRKTSSKLRYVLQDFSHLKVDLVRGKDFWKITSASKYSNLNLVNNIVVFPIVANISRLLKRLLVGEGVNEALFEDVLCGFSILSEMDSIKSAQDVEMILALRILNHLGYLGSNQSNGALTALSFDKDSIAKLNLDRKQVLFEINKALRETHL